ncbi:hypothetical protein CQ018_09340 [Arthrobacter sp. MYb227]|uniref:type II toxin-antitoxin system PemK/MazF family toxin n=1 Tax=Arthrobacter sp. MYb227 TaxID=1848601 RepID=UPI000CFB9DE3|nr:type II toxin-antitoxin system PemK/MazF family toxin [Arthrobacter sp. MYb227]PQZ93839.1 hypothetical protein CQ018_09340 [Arthrobacter sp. MYb227]
MKFNSNKVLRFLGKVLDGFLKSQNTTKAKPGSKPTAPGDQPRTPTGRANAQKPVPQPRKTHSSPNVGQCESGALHGWENGNYPGDYQGTVRPTYNPVADGQPDPGEIVWAWIPYEEDYAQGKDRPVLLVGRDGEYLLALMMTSKDHNNVQRRDRDYVDIGSGPWDKQGRASEVKVDRVIRLRAQGIRREGAVLSKDRFARVAQALSSN